jgi:hypothetical protein
MSNEEMNRKMEFIVDRQVQFVADMNVMREVQEQDGKFLKEQYRKLSDAVITVVGLVGSLTKAQSRADDRINELTQAQAHTDESCNLLAQAQTRTEERLNIFINVVERHISGNGGSESPA